MLDNRYARAAHMIALQLETESCVTVDVSTPKQDSHIFRVMNYLNHYFGKYWIEYSYPENKTAKIRKQG